jgi:hypothetical protein
MKSSFYQNFTICNPAGIIADKINTILEYLEHVDQGRRPYQTKYLVNFGDVSFYLDRVAPGIALNVEPEREGDVYLFVYSTTKKIQIAPERIVVSIETANRLFREMLLVAGFID